MLLSSARHVDHIQPAPLIPLTISDILFKRVTMDIVGPLPRSRSGKRYILVLCDYATRYPEAVALHSIDAEHIAEELVHIFACVGIPDNILTDQEANFTSILLSELYKMLHIHQLIWNLMPRRDNVNGMTAMHALVSLSQDSKCWCFFPHPVVNCLLNGKGHMR